MNKEPFGLERTYHAPIEKVWDALTDADRMRKWYFDLPDFKAEKGFAFEFGGEGKDGQKFNHKCIVTEADAPRLLAHSWTYEGLPGYSEVRFELFNEGDHTRIRLTHTGLESFVDNGTSFQQENFAEGWSMIIGENLKNFVEHTQSNG